MISRRHRQAGFTLVEVMVGLLVMTIVTIALAGAFLVGYRTISAEARQISADQAVSSASLPMLRDFTSATTVSPTPLTITSGAGTLTLTYGNPVTTVRYTIDAKNNLIRTVVGGASTVAARGMQRVVVAAPVPPCYYTLTLTPSAIGAAAVTLNLSTRVGPQGCF